MRSLFTALAFLIILLAVIPAVKRSLYPSGKRPGAKRVADNGSHSHTDQT